MLGTLIGVKVHIPPLEEIKHSFSLYFMVPGEYTLIAAALIDDPNDILRARAHCTSPDEPIICRGPVYHVQSTWYCLKLSFSFYFYLYLCNYIPNSRVKILIPTNLNISIVINMAISPKIRCSLLAMVQKGLAKYRS